ncbi:MAG: MarR family transcriptional regulator [Chloroflexi bacterium]|nr:MarR family transcriptional regulator [Chloroflexota bacterium]
MKKATRQQSKDHNTRLVLKTIYDAGEISRADIARATRLTRPTVSAIVTNLMDSKFVIETGQGPSAGGKRPTLLRVAEDSYHLLAVDLGSQEFRGALINLRGEIRHHRALPVNHQQAEAALTLVYTLLDQLTAVSTTPSWASASAHPAWSTPQKASSATPLTSIGLISPWLNS